MAAVGGGLPGPATGHPFWHWPSPRWRARWCEWVEMLSTHRFFEIPGEMGLVGRSNHLRPIYLWCYEHTALHLLAPVDLGSHLFGRLSWLKINCAVKFCKVEQSITATWWISSIKCRQYRSSWQSALAEWSDAVSNELPLMPVLFVNPKSPLFTALILLGKLFLGSRLRS